MPWCWSNCTIVALREAREGNVATACPLPVSSLVWHHFYLLCLPIICRHLVLARVLVVVPASCPIHVDLAVSRLSFICGSISLPHSLFHQLCSLQQFSFRQLFTLRQPRLHFRFRLSVWCQLLAIFCAFIFLLTLNGSSLPLPLWLSRGHSQRRHLSLTIALPLVTHRSGLSFPVSPFGDSSRSRLLGNVCERTLGPSRIWRKWRQFFLSLPLFGSLLICKLPSQAPTPPPANSQQPAK